jgi:hypothetical protein
MERTQIFQVCRNGCFVSWCLLELHEETIQITCALVIKQLDHSSEDVRQAAITCLRSLGAQGMYSLVQLEPFALLMPPPSGVAARDPASNFWGCKIAGGF